jgi:catalase
MRRNCRPTRTASRPGDDWQIAEVMKAFVAAVEQHRVWLRQAQAESVPA